MAALTVEKIEIAQELISQLNLSPQTRAEIEGILQMEKRKLESGGDERIMETRL
jgi:hypothetical protein